LGQVIYFCGIEVPHEAEGIILSQKKYVLNFISETNMLGCKPTIFLIDVKTKMSIDIGEQIDHEVPETGR
jgi:hypothetical protein